MIPEEMQNCAEESSDLYMFSNQIRATEIQTESNETLKSENEKEIHDLGHRGQVESLTLPSASRHDSESSSSSPREKRVTDSKDAKVFQSLNYTVSMSDKRHEYGDDDDFHPIAFSGALTHSGLINQSPHSGNISHRSDSSVSTRSFAFPILATEWNANSEKISSPDPRIYRQRRRFWNSCFCCRCSVLFE